MKKICSVLLTVLLILSLAACGGKSKIEDAQLRRGTVEGGTYSSQFLGVKLTAEGDWVIASDEELAQINNWTLNSFTDEDVKAQLEKGNHVIDLYVINRESGSSVNITFEKLGVSNGAMMSVDSCADALVKQLPDGLASAGIHLDNVEKTKITFAGKEEVALVMDGTYQGMLIYETMVLIKSGAYVACVTASSFVEDDTSEMLSMFKPL